MPAIPGLPRIAAGYILRRATPDGLRYLVIHDVKWGNWGFPKGHLDPDEALATAALRECAEETGIALLAVEGPALELSYIVRRGGRNGNKVVHYFPAVTRQERVRLSHEHDDHRWATAAEV
ncbi:MAG: NUDIX domain-containing protein, partial [Planctomycetota bacterium]